VAKVDTYALYSTNMFNTQFGSGIARSGAGTAEDPYTYSVTPAFANRPVGYVSWADAARFANWLHNNQPAGAQDLTTTEDGAYYLNGATSNAALLAVTREDDWKWAIPSEDEWYKAAYYDSGTSRYYDYPTGSDSVPGRDMTEATDPGNNANYQGTPYPIDWPHYSTVAGEFELSESPYGTFDQSGNVWEWNEAILDGSYRGWRGGSWAVDDGRLHAAHRSNVEHDPSNEFASVGFRVSEVPEPASLALLAVGGLALIRRRRR